MLKIIKDSTLVPTPIVDLKLDSEPRQGSTDPVTSEGVKTAIDGAVGDASASLQEQIDDIAEKAGSGYTPKGEASVATLNGLSGQENGWLYTLTDAGTLTDGTLAVVAGDTVAWDDTNSVWYKAMNYAPAQYGTNEIHNLATSITAFRTGDVIPVDGPSGTAKMGKDDLLRVTAQNALGSIHSLSETATEADLVAGNFLAIDVPGVGGATKKLPANILLKVLGTISDASLYSSYNDLPQNSSAFVWTDLNDSPTPDVPTRGTCLTISSSDAVNHKSQFLISTSSAPTSNNHFYWRSYRSGTWSGWKKIIEGEELLYKIISNISSNNGRFNPRLYNLNCNTSGALTTFNKKRLASDLIKIEDFSSVSIDPNYSHRLFCFDTDGTFIIYFDWRHTPVSHSDVLRAAPNAKYVRIYFCANDDSDLTYEDANKVFVNLVNKQSEQLSSIVNQEVNESEFAPFDGVSLNSTTGIPSVSYDTERYASRNFIPLSVVASVKSKTSSTSYRLALYTSDGGLASDFVGFTSYTTGETLISNVSSSYPTAKFFKLLVKQSDDGLIPERESIYLEYEKLHRNVISFERGNLTTIGTIDISRHNSDNASNFAKFRTGKFIDLAGAGFAKIYSLTDGNIYVYEFDASFTFVKKTQVSNYISFTPYTKYIKLMVESATSEPIVYLYSESKFGESYNIYSSTFISFLYEVANVEPVDVDVSDSSISQYTSSHYYNSGLLQLPPNYDNKGKSVPLIIFNHGSSEYSYRFTTTLSYAEERNYLIKEGFAILDCYGVSSKYHDGESYFENPATPDNIACMVGAYEWATKNYNIDRNAVFSMGKSHGGLMTLALAFTKSIPIKACAFLCPLLNWFTSGVGLGVYSYANRVNVATQLGFTNVGGLDTTALETLYTADYIAYILGNIDKIKGNNPYLMWIDGTEAYEIIEKSLSKSWSDPIFQSPRTCPTPVKVWGASDDDNVIYSELQSLVSQIKNGKGISAFRRMPDGTGGHHCVDNDPNALRVASIVTKLGYTCTNVPLAYAEVVQWFRRFGV